MNPTDELLAHIKAGYLPRSPEIDELARQAVVAQAALRARLESDDPAIRTAAEKQVEDAFLAFMMLGDGSDDTQTIR